MKKLSLVALLVAAGVLAACGGEKKPEAAAPAAPAAAPAAPAKK